MQIIARQSIIKEKLPFSYVADRYARKYSKVDPICIKTLMKYMDTVYECIKVKLQNFLPGTYGGLFDG